MNHFYPAEYGFLFEEESDFVPGIGEMITILAPGEEFLKQREALGLTQQQVADKAGILIRQYQRLESGERSLDSTSFRIGLNVCHALQIDPRFYCQARTKEEGQRVREQRLLKAKAEAEAEAEDSNAAPEEEPHNETPSRQFKYVTYRETEDGDPGEIIGVEFGTGINAVFDQISQSIRDDLSVNPDYDGCDIGIYDYEQLQDHHYSVQAVVDRPYAPRNDLYDYLVVESEQE